MSFVTHLKPSCRSAEEKMELMENHRREVEELITARWGDSLWVTLW